jgi:exonuclease III
VSLFNSMRVITWNVHGANKGSPVWKLLLDLRPDIVLLQEIRELPEVITNAFEVLSRSAVSKTGKLQRFSTGVLSNGRIIEEIKLSSKYEWVNKELSFFRGNFVSCIVQPKNCEPFHVVSVYSPAWPVDEERLREIDVLPVKLKLNPQVWLTELVWSALKNSISKNETWIVGGDYNSSETFDAEWQDKHGKRFGIRSSGNKEILDRMLVLGFTECLRGFCKDIIPTFQNTKGKRVVHQMDHLFVTNNLYSQLKRCTVGDQSTIFGKSMSDHLPIIADF